MLVYCGQTVLQIEMPLGTEVGLGPNHIVLDGDPAPRRKGAQQNPTFRPMSIVAKRLPISATAELLLLRQRIRGFTTMRYINLRFTYLLTYLLTGRYAIAIHYVP